MFYQTLTKYKVFIATLSLLNLIFLKYGFSIIYLTSTIILVLEVLTTE